MTRPSGCLTFISVKSMPLPPSLTKSEWITWSSLSEACLCPHPVQMQNKSFGHLVQKRAFAPTPLKIKCRANHLVISFKSVPLPPPHSKSNAEWITGSYLSKACLCPHPSPNAEQITWSSLSKACLCPYPAEMQSDSLGHICQKHTFAPTLLKCRVNRLVTSVKSIPLPLPCWNAEWIAWSSLSKACLCPYPAEMQSESLGHICQKHTFAPTPLQMQRELSAQVSHLRGSSAQQKQS